MNLTKLLGVALNAELPDLIIRNASMINVFTRKIENVNVVVSDGLIARVSDVNDDLTSEAETVVDATGLYLIPGLIDAHTHIEMSFMSATPFAEAILPHGTTAAIIDTHDIGNVSSECLIWLAKEIAATPLKGYITIPPCIPSSPEFEDAGIVMDLNELKLCAAADNVIAIGETMDFNRVVAREPEMMRMLTWAKENNLYIDGHCPELSGKELQAYVAAGPSTDHEFITVEEALEKYRLGMKIVVRRGTLAEPYSAGELVDRIEDTRNLLLATDGCIILDTIVNQGTMISALRTIVSEGVDPVTAVQMGTINVANAYGLEKHIGAIAPGRCADMILVEDLSSFKIHSVFVDGIKLPQPGKYHLPRFTFPESVLDTISLDPVTPDHFIVRAPIENGQIKTHVLDVKEDVLISDDYITDLPVADGIVNSVPDADILKIGVFHRYKPKSTYSIAFVKGFGFKEGALAGSIGQDSQNIVVVGVDNDSMAMAANELISMGGGVVFVAEGEVKGKISLKLGGIMNHEKHPNDLLEDFHAFNAITKTYGGAFENPAFPLSLMLTCACIPNLKLTNTTLVDAFTGKSIGLFVDF
jgi:adenine deaminase